MKTLTDRQTIQKVTELLEKKERFAFVTYTRSAIFAAVNEIKGEKKPPKYFTRAVVSGLASTDTVFHKAVQEDLLMSLKDKLGKMGLNSQDFYDPTFLEGYINDNYDVFQTFMSYYFKHNKCIVVSFQYKNVVSKYFSKESTFIHVPYNDYYDKIDQIADQIAELNQYDLVVLDCPMFSAAVAPKIWEKTNMSIIDLGKSLTVARALSKQKA